MSVKHLNLLFLFFIVIVRVDGLILSKGQEKKRIDMRRELKKMDWENCSNNDVFAMKYCYKWKIFKYIVNFCCLVLIFAFFVWLFNKGKARYEDYQFQQDPMYMSNRRRLKNTESSRKLISRKLHGLMKNIKMNQIHDFKNLQDFHKETTKRRLFHAINGITQRLFKRSISRSLFQRQYPKVVKYVTHRVNKINPRRLGLGSVLNIASDYLSHYKEFQQPGSKMLLLMNAGRMIQNLPLMLKLLNNG